MNLEYREFTKEDFEDVMALDLREIELREGWAFTGEEPMECLALSLARSRYLWVVTIDDKICGVFGLTIQEYEGGILGTPWFVSNEAPFSTFALRGLFLRTSKQIVLFMQSCCDQLTNIVSLENKEAVRWLRWLGFTLDESNQMTFDRDPELHFVLVRWVRGKGGE
jgi:hypothetical protein